MPKTAALIPKHRQRGDAEHHESHVDTDESDEPFSCRGAETAQCAVDDRDDREENRSTAPRLEQPAGRIGRRFG